MGYGDRVCLEAGDRLSGRRREFVGFGYYLCGQNPDLGVPTPRPPVEERNAAPQTRLREVSISVRLGQDSGTH